MPTNEFGHGQCESRCGSVRQALMKHPGGSLGVSGLQGLTDRPLTRRVAMRPAE